MYSSTVVAFGFEPSILPLSVLNSASVKSDVRHSALASSPVAGFAGVNGTAHFLASSGFDNTLVVVCRSFCECRQTSCLSLVNVTSHSTTPAPISMALR